MNNINYQDWIKFDLHQHTINEKPYDRKKKNNLYTHKLFYELLQKQGVNLKAVTNHNTLNITDHIKHALICKKLNISYLPGVEIDYNFSKDLSPESRFHAITILNPSNDVIKFAKTLNDLFDKKVKDPLSLNREELALLHNNIEFIFIPHALKAQGIMPGVGIKLNDELDWVTEVLENGYAFPVLFENTKDYFKYSLYNELIERKKINDIDFTIATYSGSDSLFDKDFNRKTTALQRVKYYYNGLPTYRGLELAIRNHSTRIAAGDNIIKRSNYIKTIKFRENSSFNMEGKEIILSPYLNVIIGASGSGKTLLLNEIYKNIEGNDLSVCSNSSKSNGAYEKKIGKEPLIDLEFVNDSATTKIRTFEMPNIFKEILKYSSDIKEVGKLFNINMQENINNFISTFVDDCTEYINVLNISIKNKKEGNDSIEKLKLNIDFMNANKITNSELKLNECKFNSKKLDSLTNDLLSIENIFKEKETILTHFKNIKGFVNDDPNIDKIIKIYNVLLLELSNTQNKKNKELNIQKIQESIYSTINKSINKIIKDLGVKEKTYKTNEKNASIAIDNIGKHVISFIKQKNKIDETHIIFPYDEIKNSIQKNNSNDTARYSMKFDKEDLTHVRIFNSPLINTQKNITNLKHFLNIDAEINLFDSVAMKNFVSQANDNDIEINKLFDIDIPSSLSLEFNVKNIWKQVEELNPGTIAEIAINYFFETSIKKSEPNIIFIDQPENDVDKEFITNVLSKFLINNKLIHQIFITTHDPILAINGDANVIIESSLIDHNIIKYEDFPIEYESNLLIGTNEVARILDGGRQNIKERYQKYGGILKYENSYK